LAVFWGHFETKIARCSGGQSVIGKTCIFTVFSPFDTRRVSLDFLK
jgi:hypothetical protein